MLFNSLIFAVFLPLVVMLFWILPQRYRNPFLLLASYYFYFSYNPWYLILLIGTSLLDFELVKAISRSTDHQHKRIFLLLGLLSNLGLLVAFKYSAFIYNSFIPFLAPAPDKLENLIIPAGLSFYTFQSLACIIDVYRGQYHPAHSRTDFLLFVSFFPHMLAGPVMRYGQLMPQLIAPKFFKGIDWVGFAKLCTWGYFKKMVIADNLSNAVDTVFNRVTDYSAAELFVAGVLFVIQVYCDFSGYSDIASGVAKLFRVELSLNWRRPFLARSLYDFWKRYHISITTWFRDYLYLSLGGNRVSRGIWVRNILLVFVLSGLWHGANFTFLVWGALHGCMYLIEQFVRRRMPAFRLPFILGNAYVLLFHSLALIAFRANDLNDLRHIYGSFLHHEEGYFRLSALLDLECKLHWVSLACFVALLAAKEILEEFSSNVPIASLRSKLAPYGYILLICLIFLFGNFSANTFVYFQF